MAERQVAGHTDQDERDGHNRAIGVEGDDDNKKKRGDSTLLVKSSSGSCSGHPSGGEFFRNAKQVREFHYGYRCGTNVFYS